MIVYVFFVHKKSVSKRKVCIIFIKIKNKPKKQKKNIFSKFFSWGLRLFWVGFLLPTLVKVEDNEVEIIEAEDRPEETPEVGLRAKNFLVCFAKICLENLICINRKTVVKSVLKVNLPRKLD
jgi:hypothetical protein